MSLTVRTDPRPWDSITFFKRNNSSITYELESTEANKIITEEEET